MTADRMLEDAAPRSSTATVVTWAVSAVPPAAWFLHLNVSYLLVPPSCRADARWPFAAITAVAFAAMVLPALRSRRAMREARTGELDWFLGLFGIVMAILFAGATLVVGASPVLVDPCR